MPNDFQLITNYAKEALINQFTRESLTKILESNGNSLFKFIDNHTVMIGRSEFDALANYERQDGTRTNTGYKKGNARIKWEAYSLRFDRGRQFNVDRADNDETNKLAIGTLTSEFNEQMVIPEIDAVRFSLIAKAAEEAGTYTEVAQSALVDNVIAQINKAIEYQEERKVPRTDLVLYVSPHYNTLLKQTKELVHTTRPEDFGDNKGYRANIMEYEGIPIIVVPSNMFYTNLVLDEENGYYPGAESKKINFLLVSKKAVYPVIRYNFSKIYSSDDVVTDFDGYVFNLRIYHDLFIPTNRKVAIYACVDDGTDTSTATLGHVTVKNSAGSTTGTTKFTGISVYPANLFSAKFAYYETASAPNIGDRKDLESLGTAEVTEGANITIATGTKVKVVAFDSYGKVIAVSDEITVTSKA